MVYFPDNYFEKEIRNGFEVSSMMKRAWAGQIEVLSVIREICERHNILWFADYGTLLGAVRHKGFIPWDDDMDIGMTRDNLNNFIKYAKDELLFIFQNLPHIRIERILCDVTENLHFLVAVSLTKNASFLLFQVRGFPRAIKMMQGNQPVLNVRTSTKFRG